MSCAVLNGCDAYLVAGEHLLSFPIYQHLLAMHTINKGALSRTACKHPPPKGPNIADSRRILRRFNFESGMMAKKLNQKMSSGALF